jgi:hypothetical protein
MTRRALFTISFFVFVGAIVWYASSMVSFPELTFSEAAKTGDHKTKVMVATKVIKGRDIVPEGETVTFYAVDREGTESKVFLEESDKLTASQLSTAAERGSEISIAGHVCGDQFKASNVYLPAY